MEKEKENEDADREKRNLEHIQQIQLNNFLEPIRKKGKKQISIKKGFKNMKKKNFQGFEEDKCQLVDGHYVYLPPRYGGKSRKKFRKQGVPEEYNRLCTSCFLKPCSILEYMDDIVSLNNERDSGAKEETEERLKTRYRSLVNKFVGKTYVQKLMPKNASIPACAKDAITELIA